MSHEKMVRETLAEMILDQKNSLVLCMGALVEAMKRSPMEGDSEIGTLVDATVNAYLDLHTSSLN